MPDVQWYGRSTYTGTANQVVVTGTVLSLPQDIATTSTPQFGGLGIGVAGVANKLSLPNGTEAAPPLIGVPTTTGVYFTADPVLGVSVSGVGRLIIGSSAQQMRSDMLYTWSSGAVNPSVPGDPGLGRNAAGIVEINSGVAGTFRDLKLRNLLADDTVSLLGGPSNKFKGVYLDYTNTATVGAVTINKPSGRVRIAAAGTSVVVTNSLVTAASHVFAVSSTADATARVTDVVPGAGSFTIRTVATNAETTFDFMVVNAD